MTNDKATRQAIYGALLRHVDKFVQCSDIQKAIDEVIDRLSELQPVNKTDEEVVKDVNLILHKYAKYNGIRAFMSFREYVDDRGRVMVESKTIQSLDVAREISSILPCQSDLVSKDEMFEFIQYLFPVQENERAEVPELFNEFEANKK